MTPEPRPKRDPDLALSLVAFPIPNIQVLKAVMYAEQTAVKDIDHELKQRLADAQSPGIVDPMGNPIPRPTGTFHEWFEATIDALLAKPLLSEAYGIAPMGNVMSLVQFDPSGLKLAFLLYQCIGLSLQRELDTKLAGLLANKTDYILVMTLAALKRKVNPLQVLAKLLKFNRNDPVTKAVILGEPDWASDIRFTIMACVISFLVNGAYAVENPGTTIDLWKRDQPLPVTLTPRGLRAFLHLQDQIALKDTLATPKVRAIGEAERARLLALQGQTEQKTFQQFQADLNISPLARRGN